MTQAHLAVLLYAIAGALEFGGVLTIGLDLGARRRRVLAYEQAQRQAIVMGKTARSRETPRPGRAVHGQPTLEERVTALEERAEGETDRTQAAVKAAETEMQERLVEVEDIIEATMQRRLTQIVHLIGPSESRRPAWLGFAGLLLGVLVGTAANIISATS